MTDILKEMFQKYQIGSDVPMNPGGKGGDLDPISEVCSF